MKRILLIVALICSVGFSFAQDRRLRADGKFTQVDTYLEALKAFKVPAWSAPTVSGGIAAEGSLGFNTTTSKLMVFDGEDWVNVTDTTDMSDYYTSAQVDALLLAYAKIDSVNAWLAGKVDKTVKINGYELTEDITLDADDIGALTGAAADLLYKPIGWLPDWDDVQDKPSTFPPSAHTHAIADVVGLIDSLASKQNVITGAATTIVSSNLTADRAVISNGTGKVSVSATTATELGYLSGVTSAVQTQLNDKIPLSQKGSNNGVAPLNSSGKVPSEYIDVSGMNYKGTWDAYTNTPTLADGVGSAGDLYRVTVGGTVNLGSGSITFAAGDDVVYDGSEWQKIPSTQLVVSVNGQTGAVEIGKADVGLGNVDNTSDLNKPISTATQSALDGKENVANKATSFTTLNNTLYPTTQAVANYVTSQIPSAQTLSQPSIGQIAISNGNTINLNTVNMSGNQTGIAGNKTWTGAQIISDNNLNIYRSTISSGPGIGFGTGSAYRWRFILSSESLDGTTGAHLTLYSYNASGESPIQRLTLNRDSGLVTIHALSGTGNGIVGVTSTGQLTRTNVADFGYVPYTGATSAVNLNAQNLTNVGTFRAAVTQIPTNTVEVAGKNRSYYLISHTNGLPVAKWETERWTGTAFAGTNSFGFGAYALQNNTGDASNGFGYQSLRNNTGSNSSGFGHRALDNNTGVNSSGFGAGALLNNTGGNSNGFGYQALQNNTGDNSNGFGLNALRYNKGANNNAFGHQVLNDDPGATVRTNITAIGYNIPWSAITKSYQTVFSGREIIGLDLTNERINSAAGNALVTKDWVGSQIGNGTLTLATSTGLSGSTTFTANQTGNATFTVGIDSGYKLPTTAEWGAKADTSSLGTLASLDSGTGPGNVRTNSENDSRYLQLTGGTVTGAISWSGVPSSGNHLVNKTYVDNAVSSAGGKGEWIDVPATSSYTLTWDSGMVSKYGSGGSFQVWLKDTTNEYVLQQVPIKVTFSGSNVVSYTFTLSNVDAKIMVK